MYHFLCPSVFEAPKRAIETLVMILRCRLVWRCLLRALSVQSLLAGKHWAQHSFATSLKKCCRLEFYPPEQQEMMKRINQSGPQVDNLIPGRKAQNIGSPLLLHAMCVKSVNHAGSHLFLPRI